MDLPQSHFLQSSIINSSGNSSATISVAEGRYYFATISSLVVVAFWIQILQTKTILSLISGNYYRVVLPNKNLRGLYDSWRYS